MKTTTVHLLSLATLAVCSVSSQPTDCVDTPEGPVCSVQQGLVGGTLVPTNIQKDLGLVTVGGGCSGTLLNRRWVLTADHCLSTDGRIGGPTAALSAVQISAAWSTSVATPTRFVRRWWPSGLDVALVELGFNDLGDVRPQLLYVGDVDQGASVMKYGRGIFTFAVAGPPPVLAQADGLYRGARFTVSASGATTYTTPTVNGQSGNGGDSGGADVRLGPNLENLGIAGVQSTCVATGFLASAPPPPASRWPWATGISSCNSAPVTGIRFELLQIIQNDSTPADSNITGLLPSSFNPCPTLATAGCGTSAVQRHADGKLWLWDGRTACAGLSCPGWTLIDNNTATQSVATGDSALYQRHYNGSLWKWLGRPNLWAQLDANPRTAEMAASGDTLFQRHDDGRIFVWDGSSACDTRGCAGWILLDRNPATRRIVAGANGLFQMHADGKLWKWDGKNACDDRGCPGWILIDTNPAAREIVTDGVSLFQRHSTGQIWKWDGRTACGVNGCPGWALLDRNGATVQLAAARNTLFQRHADGKLWKWDGRTACGVNGCPGWVLINTDASVRDIAAGPGTLFIRQSSGALWKWDGRTACVGNSCPGWTRLDSNPATQGVAAYGPMKIR